MFAILKKVQDAVRRMAVGSALVFIAGLIALTAAGFAIAALYEALEDAFSSQLAAAITAVILLVIAGIIALIGASVLKGPGKSKGKTRSGSRSHLHASGAGGGALSPRSRHEAGSEMAFAQQMIASGRWSPLAMALIAGIAFGASPELRREAARLLRREAENR